MRPQRYATSLLAQSIQHRTVRPVVYNGLRNNFLKRANEVGLVDKYPKSIAAAYKEHDFYRGYMKHGFFCISDEESVVWFFKNANELARIHCDDSFIYWPLEEPRLS